MSTEFNSLMAVGLPREDLSDRAAGIEKIALDIAELLEARRQVNTSPTEAQKVSGNYAKGHVSWKGLPIAIENPKGSIRSGTSKSGKTWTQKMYCDYGYFKSTAGHDGDPLDVFISNLDLDSELVHVIHQVDPDTGKFDEHKIVVGSNCEADAIDAYLSNYEKGWKGLGSVMPMTVPHFKWWLAHADTSKEIPDGHFAAPGNRKQVKAASELPVAGYNKVIRTTYEDVCPHCHEEIREKSLYADPDDPPRAWRHRSCLDKGPFLINFREPEEQRDDTQKPLLKSGSELPDYSKRLAKLIDRIDPDGREWCRRCHELWEDCRCPGKEKASTAGEDCPHCGASMERGDDGNCNSCGKPWPEGEAKRQPVVGVDLDGTLAQDYKDLGQEFDPQFIPPPRKDAKKWMDRFRAAGAILAINTVRGETDVIAAWLKKHDIPYDHINESPDQPKNSSGKLFADVYWDDRAVSAAGDLSDTGEEVIQQIKSADDDSLVYESPEDVLLIVQLLEAG